MKSVTRRITSARCSSGTVTRIEVSPSRLENSSTSNGRSRVMRGAATAGEAAVGVGGGAGVGCEGGEGDAFEPPGGPRGASFGSFGGYLSRTGDATRPTNPFEGR